MKNELLTIILSALSHLSKEYDQDYIEKALRASGVNPTDAGIMSTKDFLDAFLSRLANGKYTVAEEDCRLLGYAAVDSGTLSVQDPCYKEHFPEFDKLIPLLEKAEKQGFIHGVGVHAPIVGAKKEDGRTFEVGVVLSGFGGDGVYPVCVVKKPDGGVKRYEIRISDN